MNTHFDHDAGDMPLELERLIDRLCDQYEAELRRGRIPSLHEYLAAVSSEGRTRLRDELLSLLHEFKIDAEA
jgi:hypothetical protein